MNKFDLQSLPRVIVVATRNRGKLREFRALLSRAGWEVIGLAEAAIDGDVAETGATFAENARLKALSYSNATDLPVLADDSGLEVFSLGGVPGVRSARYAGPDASDADRVRKLLSALGKEEKSRAARFVCALALALSGELLCEAVGECRGEIAAAPRGTQGFGYDPAFLIPVLGRTLAELDPEEKNRISHRAHAVATLLTQIGCRCTPPDRRPKV
jgi:XTP/dITP diphosphohydrolase